MAIKVDNLNNLFWDNGGFRFPNTHPHLVNGEWLENITPVMTTPVTGWVVLSGEFNYCEYKGELFFLKKDVLISASKEKWRYILIKDHICTLYKNKANVIASGTLINGSLNKLQDSDFQFTFPVFNNFNKRILLPLASESFNWKKHIIPVLPVKVFDGQNALDNKDFSIFLRQLENNKEVFGGDYRFQTSNTFTLLGRAKLTKKSNNWKNELLQKIKDLLSNLEDENLVLGQITSAVGSEFLRNKWCLTWKNSHSLTTNIEQHKQVLNLNLAGLEDIELISPVTGKKDKNAYFRIPLKRVSVDESRDLITTTYIKRLSRRIRVSFLNKYSTRAIYQKSGKLQTWYCPYLDNLNFCYPQKIFIKKKPSLLAKPKYSTNFPTHRKTESFRSVYLYYCFNLNFLFQFNTKKGAQHKNYNEANFVSPRAYFRSGDPRIELSENLLESDPQGVKVITPEHNDYYPWSNKIKEPLNIGWLVGQFSHWINNQDQYFEVEKPFIVKKQITNLARIKGINNSASKLVQNADIYESPTVYGEDYTEFTLDVFNTLPARARQVTLEEDFLTGEKLLFTCWGLATYALFQPILDDGYEYNKSALDRNNTLLGKWLYDTSWFYGYYIFGDDSYPLSAWAKQWFKKAYDNWRALEYKNFYASQENYAALKTHIRKNTEQYFVTENVDFSETPIQSLKKGDIFFSDLEWFFYDHSGNKDLTERNTDWFNHVNDVDAQLGNGEIVVYHNIQKGGISLGRATVWEAETTLPEGQFIAEGNQISEYSSNVNKTTARFTKITEIENFESFDSVINKLQNLSGADNNIFSEVAHFSFEELTKSGAYLFDLKGTDFYCFLDVEGKVHLIFKEGDRDIKVNKKQVYAIAGTDAIAQLDKEQWVNQKIVLSIYGRKVDLPIKAFQQKIIATIELDTAVIENEKQELIDSHKVNVTHALGETYLRFDTPKIQAKGVTQFNAYQMESMDIANMRAYEDYLIKRKEYQLAIENMEVEHNNLRFNLRQELATNATNSIMGIIGGSLALAGGIGATVGAFATGGAAGIAAMALFGTAAKAFKGVASTAISQNVYQQKVDLTEQKIQNAIRQQALNSYTIDLTFARQKEDYAIHLRNLFASQSFNQSSSRERAQALDDKEEELQTLPRKEDKEIYLELWTISDKQKEFIEGYHAEYGVDCRVSNYLLAIGNGIKTGVYRMESVELHHLNDRIDLLLIKALLENGIQIVEWIEHEKVRELIPEDPRIAKLQQQIEEQRSLKEKLEEEKRALDTRIQELIEQLGEVKEEEEKLTNEIKEKAEKIQNIEKQLESEASKYHDLSESYRRLEGEKAQEERLKKLYLDEKNKLTTERDAANVELRSKRKEILRINKTNASLQSQLESVRADLNKVSRSSEDCLARERVLLSEKQASNREIESLKREKQQLEEKVKECAKLEEKAEQLEETQEELKKLKEEVSQLIQGCGTIEEVKETYAEVQKNFKALAREHRQLSQDLPKLVDTENQLRQARQEIATLKASPAVAPSTKKEVDYVISKKNNGDLVILAWNDKYGIYQEQPNLTVKENSLNLMYRIGKVNDVDDKAFVTDNYPFLGRFVEVRFENFKKKEAKYETLLNNLDGKRDNSKTANPKTAYAWLSRVSIELDHNVPFIASGDVTDDTALFKKFYYHTTKGWFDYQIEGSKLVNNYKEYKETIANEKDNKIAELSKELQETKDSLAAVRELENQAPKLRDGKDVLNSFFNNFLKNLFSGYWGIRYYRLYFQGNYDHLGIAMWNETYGCFVSTGTTAKPKKYTSYSLYRIEADNLRFYWDSDSYYTQKMTSWSEVAKHIMAGKGLAYAGNEPHDFQQYPSIPIFKSPPSDFSLENRNSWVLWITDTDVKYSAMYSKHQGKFVQLSNGDEYIGSYRNYRQALHHMITGVWEEDVNKLI